tara:strand:+ start:2116 stop:2340 length:225 start_codon:yes stop_codon:yes gene_type:complete
MPTKLIAVNSTNIKSMGYRRKDKTLIMKFHNQTTYHYSPVDEERYTELRSSISVGSHFNKNFRGDKSLTVIKKP